MDIDKIQEKHKDIFGTTYQYCIKKFAEYEGVKGGEFYTPESVVKTIVAILRPSEDSRIYESKTQNLIKLTITLLGVSHRLYGCRFYRPARFYTWG